MPDFSKRIIYLSDAQRQELFTNDTITVDGVTITYNENDIYVTPQSEPVTDVQMNGTSILSGGVANISTDASPTQNSANPVQSGGVYSANAAQNTQIANLKSDLGVVEDTDTAVHTISEGQYVIWKGVLYTAKTAIPSGTALSTSNLQAASNGGLNAIISSLYYKAGDVVSGNFECYGFITSGGKDVNFFIPMPKLTKNISGCNFSKLKIALRIPSGGYVESNWYDVLSDSNYTVNNVASSNGGAILLINLTKNTVISNVTNNTPLVGRTEITGTFT